MYTNKQTKTRWCSNSVLKVLDECDALVFAKIVSYARSHSITHLMSHTGSYTKSQLRIKTWCTNFID